MKLLRIFLSGVLICCSAAASDAATLIWNASGGSSNLWTAASNWSPAQRPTDKDSLVFPNSSVNTTTLPDLGDVDFTELRFQKPGYLVGGSSPNLRVDARTVSVLHTSGGTQFSSRCG